MPTTSSLFRSSLLASVALIGGAVAAPALVAVAEAAPFPPDHPSDRKRDIPAYTVYAPADADTAKVYPTILLLPPGPQSPELAKAVGESLKDEATKRGWVLIVPRPTLNPGTTNPLFLEKANNELAGLVKHLDTWLKPEGGKFYVAGASNGGVSAVRFGLDFPSRTAALLAYPGAMPPALPKSDAGKLRGFPVRLWVGETDTKPWHDAAKLLSEAGKTCALDLVVNTVAGEGHVIRTLTPAKIMDELAAFRTQARGESGMTPAQAAVLARLDELHQTASSAISIGSAAFDKYFACFAPNGVFIGTDAGERWSVEQFKAYAKPLFEVKKGWTYVPRPGTRHVEISPDGNTAWFDELLDNAKYGVTRGTGVLVRSGTADTGTWLIAQYHLTIPVPNELADRVSKMIKSNEKK